MPKKKTNPNHYLNSLKFKLSGKWETREVWLNGEPLSPVRSLRVRNASPGGFLWGYGGSGPAQLALAICLELFDDEFTAEKIHQDFKDQHIATLPSDSFSTEIEVSPDILSTVNRLKEWRKNILRD